MPSTVQELTERQLVRPPSFLPQNTMYETIMGSVAYGVSSDTSDMDVYGFCMPPKNNIFPHLAGEIFGFGRQVQRFEQWQQHHIEDKDALRGKGRVYDLTVYSIVRYFQLCLENNPNMIDSLFTPHDCVLHITKIGEMVRGARRMFLHKGSWPKFKGYAYAQLHKMKSREATGKRKHIIEQFGYDVKFGYHVIRLLDEAEQIMLEGNIDLRRNREQLKAIRRGDVPEADLMSMAAEKEKALERVYESSTLQHSPDESKIKELLLQCLEEHYGSMNGIIVTDDRYAAAIRGIQDIVGKF